MRRFRCRSLASRRKMALGLRSASNVHGSTTAGLNLDERFCRRRARNGLRIAPVVHVSNLVHAGDSAKRRATLLRKVLAANIGQRILGKRLGRKTALLGTVVHEAVLTHIEITRSSAAAPGARAAVRDIVLKAVDLRKILLLEALHRQKDLAL